MDNQERFLKDLLAIPRRSYKTYIIDGFDAVVYRTDLGHLCGYVRIPLYSTLDGEKEIDCHGGITFQGERDFGTTNGNYIGFDCAHLGDWTPIDSGLGDEIYKDTNFVLNELKHIVKQLKEK